MTEHTTKASGNKKEKTQYSCPKERGDIFKTMEDMKSGNYETHYSLEELSEAMEKW